MPKGTVFQPCHFGEWVQGRVGVDGPLALITLLPHGVGLFARVTPATQPSCQAIAQGRLPPKRLRGFLASLGLPMRGRFETRLPFAPGMGTGMSTATLIAVARLAGFQGSPDALARACLQAEGASDPLMYPTADRILWAPRKGQKLGSLPALPRAHLLAGFYGPPCPTDAADQNYDDVTDLLAAWTRAQTLAEFAALASESARRCHVRRGFTPDPTAALADRLGALGWITSHSGAARALIFAPGTLPPHGPEAFRQAGLRGTRHLITGDT